MASLGVALSAHFYEPIGFIRTEPWQPGDFTEEHVTNVQWPGENEDIRHYFAGEETPWIVPYNTVKATAEKYGVGFVCNEFAMCGVRVYWDIGLVTAVHETYLNMMKKYDLGWCYSEEFNIFPKHLRILYGDESQWTGATVEEVTYTYDDGRTETVKYCKELVDQLRAHTIK